MAEGLVRGGISRAVAEAIQGTRITSVEAQKTVVCPRPRLPSLRRVCSTEHMIEDDAVVPSKEQDSSDIDASITELRRILEVDCTLDSDSSNTFLGISPPLRSGACNPLAQDSDWKQKAQQASRSSLEALHSMDSGIIRPAAIQCRGDHRLLFASPTNGAVLGAVPSHYDAPFSSQRGLPSRSSCLVGASWRSGSGLAEGTSIFG